MRFPNLRVTAISCSDRLQYLKRCNARLTALVEEIRNGQLTLYENSVSA
jgi:hypothetical protein